MILKRVVNIACLLVLALTLALAPAAPVAAGTMEGGDSSQAWWSPITNWLSAAVEAVMSVSATSEDDDDQAEDPPPPPPPADSWPGGSTTNSGPWIDPDG